MTGIDPIIRLLCRVNSEHGGNIGQNLWTGVNKRVDKEEGRNWFSNRMMHDWNRHIHLIVMLRKEGPLREIIVRQWCIDNGN